MAEETAKFVLETETDPGPVKEATAELEKYRAAINKSQGALGDYRKSLSLLKGSSAEVSDEKKKLKALIENEKQKITQNNLAILKLGSSYDKLTKAQRKSNDTFAAGRKAISAIGGPVKGLGGNFEELSGILGMVTTGTGALALASAVAVAGLALLGAGAIALVAKFTEWVVSSGDMLRNLQLSREAFSGSEKSATAWGHQVDWARTRIALTTEQLSDLTNETNKAFLNTRISGQGMVDVWKAVALAKGAGRDDTASKIMGIVERAKMSGRGGIQRTGAGIDELQGTGLSRQKVALQLATDLKVSYQRANLALAMGVVPATQLAKALREASEAQFGSLNEKKMQSLSGLWSTLIDNVTNWASALAQADGPLAPLLADMKSLVDMTGLQSQGGQDAKNAVTSYALELSKLVHENLPMLKGMVSTTIALVSGFAQAAAAVVEFASSSEGMAIIYATLAGIAAVAAVVAIAVGLIGVAAVGVVESFRALWAIGKFIGNGLYKVFSSIFDPEAWKKLGAAAVDGIVTGFKEGLDVLAGSVADMGKLIKEAFKKILGIHSPSKVFRYYGQMTAEGFAGGVDDGKPGARASARGLGDAATGETQRAARAMGASPAATAMIATAQASDAGNADAADSAPVATPAINIKLEFNFTGAKDSQTAQLVQSHSFLEGVTHALQTALRSAGVTTGSVVTAGG